jgi:hypothetical protein
MKIFLRTLDVWRLDSTRRIVVRSGDDYNKFCLISAGTGESSKSMDAKTIFDYLVYGKNPLMLKNRKDANILPIFVKELNLKEIFSRELGNFNNYASILVWSEDVTDKEILRYHFSENESDRRTDSIC